MSWIADVGTHPPTPLQHACKITDALFVGTFGSIECFKTLMTSTTKSLRDKVARMLVDKDGLSAAGHTQHTACSSTNITLLSTPRCGAFCLPTVHLTSAVFANAEELYGMMSCRLSRFKAVFRAVATVTRICNPRHDSHLSFCADARELGGSATG